MAVILLPLGLVYIGVPQIHQMQLLILGSVGAAGWIAVAWRPTALTWPVLVAPLPLLATMTLSSLASGYPTLSWSATWMTAAYAGIFWLLALQASHIDGRRNLIVVIGIVVLLALVTFLVAVLLEWRDWLGLGFPVTSLPLRPRSVGGLAQIPTWLADVLALGSPLRRREPLESRRADRRDHPRVGRSRCDRGDRDALGPADRGHRGHCVDRRGPDRRRSPCPAEGRGSSSSALRSPWRSPCRSSHSAPVGASTRGGRRRTPVRSPRSRNLPCWERAPRPTRSSGCGTRSMSSDTSRFRTPTTSCSTPWPKPGSSASLGLLATIAFVGLAISGSWRASQDDRPIIGGALFGVAIFAGHGMVDVMFALSGIVLVAIGVVSLARRRTRRHVRRRVALPSSTCGLG